MLIMTARTCHAIPLRAVGDSVSEVVTIARAGVTNMHRLVSLQRPTQAGRLGTPSPAGVKLIVRHRKFMYNRSLLTPVMLCVFLFCEW